MGRLRAKQQSPLLRDGVEPRKGRPRGPVVNSIGEMPYSASLSFGRTFSSHAFGIPGPQDLTPSAGPASIVPARCESVLQAVISGPSRPVLLVTRGGKVLFLNTGAVRLIRNADGLAVRDGILGTLVPDETRSLRALVAGAVKSPGGQVGSAGGLLRVSRPDGQAPLEVLISPLQCWENNCMQRDQHLVAVFVTDRSPGAVAEGASLKTLYGLTTKEVRVAMAISRGLMGKEICRELRISYNTLKTHLKHIHAKTRTKSQVDLFRVLAGGLRI